MNIFAYFAKRFAGESTAQDAQLPLNINFKTTVSFEKNVIIAAIMRGVMLNVSLGNLDFLTVQAISSLVLNGMTDKKMHRFYFTKIGDDQPFFLQTLSDSDNPHNIAEILLCCSRLEPPNGADDIAFFMGDNRQGLGEPYYRFSPDDLTSFLSEEEVSKRLTANDDEGSIDYTRVDAAQDFMPAFTGVETVIFDAYGTTGESRQILNLMPHSRQLSGNTSEQLIVGFWVVTSKNGKTIALNQQLPLADYIFAIRLEPTNINVI
jgi:hypothetical protein